MKKKLKSIITLSLAICLLVVSVGFVSSATVHMVIVDNGWWSTSATIWFNPSIESFDDYGMEPGRHIKRAYVRLQRGDHDTGRVWKEEARSPYEDRTIETSTSLSNRPFSTMYANWGWRYF